MLFTTTRLLVRAFSEQDSAHYWRESAFPEICFLGDERLQRQTLGRVACFERVTNTFVATGTLRYLPDFAQFDIGYRVAEAHQGKGFASELCAGLTQYAIAQRGIVPVALVSADNAASIRVLQKCGYQFQRDVFSTCLAKELQLFRYAP